MTRAGCWILVWGSSNGSMRKEKACNIYYLQNEGSKVSPPAKWPWTVELMKWHSLRWTLSWDSRSLLNPRRTHICDPSLKKMEKSAILCTAHTWTSSMYSLSLEKSDQTRRRILIPYLVCSCSILTFQTEQRWKTLTWPCGWWIIIRPTTTFQRTQNWEPVATQFIANVLTKDILCFRIKTLKLEPHIIYKESNHSHSYSRSRPWYQRPTHRTKIIPLYNMVNRDNVIISRRDVSFTVLPCKHAVNFSSVFSEHRLDRRLKCNLWRLLIARWKHWARVAS